MGLLPSPDFRQSIYDFLKKLINTPYLCVFSKASRLNRAFAGQDQHAPVKNLKIIEIVVGPLDFQWSDHYASQFFI
jgi:hypothetical protein